MLARMRTPMGGVLAPLSGVLAPLGGAVAVLGQFAGHGQFTGHAVGLAAAALAFMLVGLLAHAARVARAVTVVPLHARAVGLRARSRRTAFVRQRDPAAAGRPRPRAPSVNPAAA